MSYLLTVIIPVYNVESYLEQCLNSLLLQDIERVEIIIINDGSTDNSLSIIKNLTENYKNIIIINQNNQGVSSARNQGIKKAKGEYIYFLDADDYIKHGMISKFKSINKDIDDLDIISFGYRALNLKNCTIKDYDNKEIDGKVFDGREFNKLFLSKRLDQHICSFIFKKTLVDNYNIKFNKEITLGEDVSFQIKVFSIAEKIIYSSEIFFIYNYNPCSQTNIQFHEGHLSCVLNYEDVRAFLEKNSLDDLIPYINFYYQYMYFYELQFFLNAPTEVLAQYMASDDILDTRYKFIISKKGIALCFLKLIYNFNKTFLFKLLKYRVN